MGCASDVPRVDDWFATRLGGRSVFVQRFKDGLRGFENRCAHRSYPLRAAQRGNGPVVCGFHHWRYDSEGLAAGVPNCPDAFGATPRELGRRLLRLDLDTRGDLVFARFPGPGPTLAEFLGPAFEVLAALRAEMGGALRGTCPTQANWRLLQWIGLDEYHLAAVHPGSFGAKGRYLPRRALNYTRIGAHSAYLLGAQSGSLADWLEHLRAGRRDPVPYRILHLFPDTAILLPAGVTVLGQQFRYLAILRHRAEALDRSTTQRWIRRARHERGPPGALARVLDLFEPIRLPIVRHLSGRVLREDGAVCERLQAGARQIAPDPLYGAAEARVAWFNEAYAEAMRDPTT